jgi:geranylgeranylglycerol-phosphate geranylgeranyltransferase
VNRLARIRRPVAAWMELIRWHVVLTGALYTALGAYLSAGWNGVLSRGVACSACVVALVIAFGNVINDCIDADADRIAKPYRPIPSGRVSLRSARAVAVSLASVSLAAGTVLRPEQQLFAVGTILLSAAYSLGLKGVRFIGHGSVGLLCGSILVYSGLAAGGVTRAGLVAAAMTSLYVFAEEILGALVQEKEDRASNVATTVTRIGRRNGVNLFIALAMAFVLVSLWPWAAGFAPYRYLAALIPLTVTPTISMVWALRVRPSDATVAACSKVSRVVWYTSVATIILLR